jgi:hypothetical protein
LPGLVFFGDADTGRVTEPVVVVGCGIAQLAKGARPPIRGWIVVAGDKKRPSGMCRLLCPSNNSGAIGRPHRLRTSSPGKGRVSGFDQTESLRFGHGILRR